jgi:CRP-like cAMP-binding protein
VELVAHHPLLDGLPGDAVRQVAGCASTRGFRPGELLLREDEPADTFYLIRRGRVAIEVYWPGRGPVAVETVGAGACVGWSWMVPPYRWRFDARALETVVAVAVDGACLRAKAETDPALGYPLMQRVAAMLLDRLQATRLRVIDLYRDHRGG